MRVFILTIAILCGICVSNVRAEEAEINKSLQEQMLALQKQISALTQDEEQKTAQVTRENAKEGNTVLSLERNLTILSGTILKDDHVLKDFQKLCEQSKQVCYFVSELWMNNALKSCVDFNNYVYQEMTSYENITKQQQSFYGAKMEQCRIFDLYKNLDEIDETIKNALKHTNTKK